MTERRRRFKEDKTSQNFSCLQEVTVKSPKKRQEADQILRKREGKEARIPSSKGIRQETTKKESKPKASARKASQCKKKMIIKVKEGEDKRQAKR